MSECLSFGNNPFTPILLNSIPDDPLTVDFLTEKSGLLVDPLFFCPLQVLLNS